MRASCLLPEKIFLAALGGHESRRRCRFHVLQDSSILQRYGLEFLLFLACSLNVLSRLQDWVETGSVVALTRRYQVLQLSVRLTAAHLHLVLELLFDLAWLLASVLSVCNKVQEVVMPPTS